jgi:hypothetical protein
MDKRIYENTEKGENAIGLFGLTYFMLPGFNVIKMFIMDAAFE